jgi:hypothetical protein
LSEAGSQGWGWGEVVSALIIMTCDTIITISLIEPQICRSRSNISLFAPPYLLLPKFEPTLTEVVD